MSNKDIVRAWKDKEYRESLSKAERDMLPEHPAGVINLTDAEIDEAAGGTIFTLIGGYTCPYTLCYTCWYQCTAKQG